jgi:hypothetical protein
MDARGTSEIVVNTMRTHVLSNGIAQGTSKKTGLTPRPRYGQSRSLKNVKGLESDAIDGKKLVQTN